MGIVFFENGHEIMGMDIHEETKKEVMKKINVFYQFWGDIVTFPE